MFANLIHITFFHLGKLLGSILEMYALIFNQKQHSGGQNVPD